MELSISIITFTTNMKRRFKPQHNTQKVSRNNSPLCTINSKVSRNRNPANRLESVTGPSAQNTEPNQKLNLTSLGPKYKFTSAVTETKKICMNLNLKGIGSSNRISIKDVEKLSFQGIGKPLTFNQPMS